MSDYDYPKSARASHVMEGYDVPRNGKRSTPPHLLGERSIPPIPSQFKRSSDSSGESRPISLSSGSLVSADTSSGSLDSSLSGRELPGYDVPRRTVHQATPTVPPIRQSELNLDAQLAEIDGLMEEVNQQQQRIRSNPSVSSANRITLDGYELGGLSARPLVAGEGESKRSSSSMQGSLSSRSGSNDTLGIWDDVSYPEEEDSGESEESDNGVGGASGKGEAGGEMLDSWIKELESGMKGMSGVAGVTTTEVGSI